MQVRKTYLMKSAALALCMATLMGCATVGGDDKTTAKTGNNAATTAPAKSQVDAAWLDNMEKGLKTAVAGSNFSVERRGDVLAVIAPADTSFNKDRPQMLLPIALRPITQVAKQMAGDPNTAVLVAGHADNQGSADVRKLTEDRALSVGAIFRLSGLKSERLVLMGFGADKPRASNADATGRAANRRVEMLVTQRAASALLTQAQAQPVAATPAAAVPAAPAPSSNSNTARSKAK